MPLVRRPRVLLAYDDIALRHQIGRALQSDGFEVVEAMDGLELLAQVTLATDGASVRSLIATALRGDQGDNHNRLEDGEDALPGEFESVGTLRNEPWTSFAVIVAPSRIPGLIGLSVLALLRCAQRSTPVVLLTPFGDELASGPVSDELGIVSIFDKPIDIDELRAVVRDSIVR